MYRTSEEMIRDWQALRVQLLQQWQQITAKEIDAIGPYRHQIALLVERKYGVDCRWVENYLSNFEHTMPFEAVN